MRIDKLTYGQSVRLRFCGSKSLGNEPYEDDAIFRGIDGEGDDRRATFEMDGMTWEAYRFNGMWAYGTSAERLSLVGVNEVAR